TDRRSPWRWETFGHGSCNVRDLATTLVLRLVLLIAVPVWSGELAAADSFADKIESLAAKCDELGLKEPAAATRGWLIPRHAGRQYLFVPETSDPTRPDWLRIAATD